MSARIHKPTLVWTPVDLPDSADITKALETALNAWRGTPYESGQRFIQRGADCIGAVCGVLDMLDGRDRASYPDIPQDTAMHDPVTAVAALMRTMSRYEPCHALTARDCITYVQPGDIVITGAPGKGPGHAEIVGSKKNELWHTTPASGFHQGGWSFFLQQTLYAVYRIDDRKEWIRE